MGGKSVCWSLDGAVVRSIEHLLDYSNGEAHHTSDQPGVYDRNGLSQPQDVVESWAVTWSQHGNALQPSHEAGTGLELGIEWYGDVLRAKLVSLCLPKRLLVAYRDKVLEQIEELQSRL